MVSQTANLLAIVTLDDGTSIDVLRNLADRDDGNVANILELRRHIGLRRLIIYPLFREAL